MKCGPVLEDGAMCGLFAVGALDLFISGPIGRGLLPGFAPEQVGHEASPRPFVLRGLT